MSIVSDETCGGASQKTEEIEEIFADIPKLPNVAAIIAPKQQQQQQQKNEKDTQQQCKTKSLLSDYLIMTPKVETTTTMPQFQAVQNLLINTTPSEININNNIKKLNLVIGGSGSGGVIANNKKFISCNGNVTTNTRLNNNNTTIDTINNPLPLQAEFDWYNLDAEYGKVSSNSLVTVGEHKVVQNGGGVLTEIHEEMHECEHVTTTADEYNLDEEFSLISEQPEIIINNNNSDNLKSVLRPTVRMKRINKNRETFEKFIEGSGLSTKPLLHKRKIYFAAPYV